MSFCCRNDEEEDKAEEEEDDGEEQYEFSLSAVIEECARMASQLKTIHPIRAVLQMGAGAQKSAKLYRVRVLVTKRRRIRNRRLPSFPLAIGSRMAFRLSF